jgi:hypothetical protein
VARNGVGLTNYLSPTRAGTARIFGHGVLFFGARTSKQQGVLWFAKCNVNGNDNDSHSNTGGNKFE